MAWGNTALITRFHNNQLSTDEINPSKISKSKVIPKKLPGPVRKIGMTVTNMCQLGNFKGL